MKTVFSSRYEVVQSVCYIDRGNNSINSANKYDIDQPISTEKNGTTSKNKPRDNKYMNTQI